MKLSTEQNYRLRIARVIEAILVDPAAPHTVESLAAIAHLSSFHFHRIYRAMTGEGVAETLRRVRLAQAANRLAAEGTSVTATALDVGYGSSQSFARAFRDLTGLSPSEFQIRQEALAAFGLDQAEPDGTGISITLTELPTINALCLRHQGPLATIPHTFRRLLQKIHCDGEVSSVGSAIGIATGDPEERESFSYFIGIVPSGSIEPMNGVDLIRVDGGLYAMHRLVGPYALIAPTFRTLFGGWLPRSGYEPDDRPALELYRDMPPSVAPQDCVTDMLIPLRKQ